MNSVTQLALMTKAKKVFGSDETFLSFPVSPLPYTKRDLDFFAEPNDDELRRSVRNLQAFSTLVNLIPDGEAWIPEENLFLWDVYKDVLLEGDFATSTRTPEEEATYQQALAFLRVSGEGGMLEDSPAVKAYRQHKDAYLLALQKYNADKFTGENADDSKERQRWRDITEPAQRANLDDLNTKWIIAGNKNEVEAAQAKVVSLGARSPLQTWTEWRSRFNEHIDSLTSAEDGSTVFPSFFSPSNAIDDNAWQSFKLSKDEVKILIKEASPELRARFAADKDGKANSLSFEFTSASIQRPWYVSEAFRARFWRFADPDRLISDGGQPANGPCPAYVTAVVFARRMKEEKPKPSFLAGLGMQLLASAATSAATSATTSGSFQFGGVVRDHRERPATVVRDHRDVQAPIVRDHRSVPTPIVRDHRTVERTTAVVSPGRPRPGLSANVTPTPAAPNTKSAGGLKGFGLMMLRNSVMSQTDVVRSAETEPVIDRKASSVGLSNLQVLSFQRPVETSAQLPSPANPTSAPSELSVQDDSIYILAFICKNLPKCPDPDPSLQW